MNKPWTPQTVIELYSLDGPEGLKGRVEAVVNAHNKEVAELQEKIDRLAKTGAELARIAFGEMERQVNDL